MASKKRTIYNGEIVAGSLMLPESRKIAGLLLKKVSEDEWYNAIVNNNILQKRSPATATRQSKLIKKRLELVEPVLWHLIEDGGAEVATQAVLVAAIKHSKLLGDFMDRVCRQHWQTFTPELSHTDWRSYLESCTQVDPIIGSWSESTITKLRQVVFRILAEANYLDNTRTLELQAKQIVPEIEDYLKNNQEDYVLRCMEITS